MNAVAPGAAPTGGPLSESRRWRDDDGFHVDVRGLLPPGPLAAILDLIDSNDDGTPIIVHHERDPKLRYAELAELGWSARHVDGDPGEFLLRLERVA